MRRIKKHINKGNVIYSIDYKTTQPFSAWYEVLLSLNEFIRARVREVKCKYEAKLKENNAFIDSEYKRGYEFGLIAEQHHDERLNIVKSKNNELIGLEANIKSTLEKVLKDITKEYAIDCRIGKRKKESFLAFYIRSIEKKKMLKMRRFKQHLKIINAMVLNRNSSEHELDALFRKIDERYIILILNTTHQYMNEFILQLYKSDKQYK